MNLENEIAVIVTTVCRLPDDPASLDPLANLFEMGVSSFQTVQVMLALEERFAFQFPDAFLRKEHFASVHALSLAISTILAQPGTAA